VLWAYRVLDLTDERGQRSGQILASLRAEVILVEPPRGVERPAHRAVAGDEPGPETSPPFWATNRGKRSIELDLDTLAGADAVVAALIARHERHLSGLGQHADISAQQSMMQATQSMVLAQPLGATSLARVAGGVRWGRCTSS
jgi:crotonobetainyl-CoA:carnitine CoA-transferase CaiB-like acyl-CoA transferase